MGLGGAIGKGEHFMSWIHVQDLSRLYASAAEDNIFSGIYNAVSPQYVNNQEFTRALSQSLRRPRLSSNSSLYAQNTIRGDVNNHARLTKNYFHKDKADSLFFSIPLYPTGPR